MNVYAESSAVLWWLLDEPDGEAVRAVLETADVVVASRLTQLECLRGLVRLQALGARDAESLRRVAEVFARASAEWTMIDIVPEVLDRAATPFPEEPVRALDAIHLATLQVVRATGADVAVAALDRRVRRNATRLGIPVVP